MEAEERVVGQGGNIHSFCCCVLLRSRCVEAVGCKVMVVYTCEVCGMRATKEKVAEPTNNDVLEVGRDRSMGILT